MVRCCRRRREKRAPNGSSDKTGAETVAASADVIGSSVVNQSVVNQVEGKRVGVNSPVWQIPKEASLDLELGYFVARPSRAPQPGDDMRTSDVPLKEMLSDFNMNSESVVIKGIPCQDSNIDGPQLSNDEAADVVQGLVCDDTPAGLQLLGKLCKAARVLDAVEELDRIEARSGPIDEALRLEGGVPVAFLRLVHRRMQESIERTLGPGMRRDVKWNRVLVREDKIDPEFKLEVGLRFAEGAEVDAKGPASQLVICGKMTNYPLSLSQYTGLLVEADLLSKEWIKDCDLLEATPGKSERLQGAVVNSHVVPALLPLRFQELVVRGFSVCHEPPVEALRRGDAPVCQPERPSPASVSNGSAAQVAAGGGLLVYEVAPPDGITEFDGWPLPVSHRRVTRLAGVTKVLWITQSSTRPDCCDILATARMGLPLSKWMVPMDLLKRLAADQFRDSLLRIKQGCADHWSELEYERRASESRDFYGEISGIQHKAKAAGHCKGA